MERKEFISAQEYLEQQLEEIIEEAGNPQFLEWTTAFRGEKHRLYAFEDGTKKILLTEESLDEGIKVCGWINEETLEANQPEMLEWASKMFGEEVIAVDVGIIEGRSQEHPLPPPGRYRAVLYYFPQ